MAQLCEFLGRALTPGPKCAPLCFLKLDFNNFGSAGVENLALGLKNNEFLKMISLCYCGIDEDGARPLFEMLIFSYLHQTLEFQTQMLIIRYVSGCSKSFGYEQFGFPDCLGIHVGLARFGKLIAFMCPMFV